MSFQFAPLREIDHRLERSGSQSERDAHLGGCDRHAQQDGSAGSPPFVANADGGGNVGGVTTSGYKENLDWARTFGSH
jgi:hypothetical protein